MNALILYFSGTGNTKTVAEMVGNELLKNSCNVQIHSIEEHFNIIPDSYDLLVLGCPKYYEYPELGFIDHIKQSIPTSSNKIPTMIFCTQAGSSSTDFKQIRKILLKKNHELIIEKSFTFSNNLLVFKSFKPTDKQEIIKNVDKIQKNVHNCANELLEGIYDTESIGAFKAFIERSTAVLCKSLFASIMMKFSASDKCKGCGLCSEMCPKDNIEMKNGRPTFGKKCMLCSRCINICPVNAIMYNNKECDQYRDNINKVIK